MIVQIDSFPLCFDLQSDRIPFDETKLESESLAWQARQESCGIHSEINRESIGTMINPLTIVDCLVYRLLISNIGYQSTPNVNMGETIKRMLRGCLSHAVWRERPWPLARGHYRSKGYLLCQAMIDLHLSITPRTKPKETFTSHQKE